MQTKFNEEMVSSVGEQEIFSSLTMSELSWKRFEQLNLLITNIIEHLNSLLKEKVDEDKHMKFLQLKDQVNGNTTLL